MAKSRTWKIVRYGIKYELVLIGIKLHLWTNRGGKLFMAKKVLEKGEDYNRIKTIFGESELFSEVLQALDEAQADFEERHPTLYQKN